VFKDAGGTRCTGVLQKFARNGQRRHSAHGEPAARRVVADSSAGSAAPGMSGTRRAAAMEEAVPPPEAPSGGAAPDQPFRSRGMSAQKRTERHIW